jgi:hypothetical protein
MRPLALAAIDVYASFQWDGWWYRLWSALRGRSSRLLDLKTIAANNTIRARHAASLQVVSIGQIRGSEGRADDFDAAFHPLQSHTEVRWRSVARAWLGGITMPPVELVQIGDTYFVRDGHHRISVARALGQQAIEAHVTIWQIEQPAARPPACAPAPEACRAIGAASLASCEC